MNPTSIRHLHPTLVTDDPHSSGIRRASVGWGREKKIVATSYSSSLSLPLASGVGYSLRISRQVPRPTPLPGFRTVSGRGIRIPHPTPDRPAPGGRLGVGDHFHTASLGLRPRHVGLTTSLAGGAACLPEARP